MRIPARISSIRRNRSHQQLLDYHNTTRALFLELDRVIAADQVGGQWACSELLRSYIAWHDKQEPK